MIVGSVASVASSMVHGVPTMDHVRPTFGRPLILDILRAQLEIEHYFFCALHVEVPCDNLINITIEAGQYARLETIELDIEVVEATK